MIGQKFKAGETYIFEKFGPNAHRNPSDHFRLAFKVLSVGSTSMLIAAGEENILVPFSHEVFTSSIPLSESRYTERNL